MWAVAVLVCFDFNCYSIDPALTGRQIELTADLNQVRVLCDLTWATIEA